MRSIAVSLMVTLLAPPAIAQSNRPPNWRVRTEAPTTDTIIHQVMAPGWHITSGPPAILFDPANQARGRFAVESSSSPGNPATGTASSSGARTSKALAQPGSRSS